MPNVELSFKGNGFIANLPAGNYFVGDPMALLNKEDLSEYISRNCEDGVYDRFMIVKVPNGQGWYIDNKNLDYYLSSGNFGVVDIKYLTSSNSLSIDELSQVGKFVKSWNCISMMFAESTQMVHVIIDGDCHVLDFSRRGSDIPKSPINTLNNTIDF